MKERTSASDEKFQNNFEILPYTVVNIRQVIKGFTFPLTHRHLFTYLLYRYTECFLFDLHLFLILPFSQGGSINRRKWSKIFVFILYSIHLVIKLL